MKIENVEVYGWDAAIRCVHALEVVSGETDSYWTHIENPLTLNTARFCFTAGENDLKIMSKKYDWFDSQFLRMITVMFDITARKSWLTDKSVGYIVANMCFHKSDIRMQVWKGSTKLNYFELREIYAAPRNSSIFEWRAFCKWIEDLPYARELICGGTK